MQNRKIIYQILALLAASGVILSYLFGPGKVAPEATVYTGLSALLLFCAQYFALRETVRSKGKKLTTLWVITTLVILAMIVALEVILLTIVSLIWIAVLPTFALIILTLLFELLRSRNK